MQREIIPDYSFMASPRCGANTRQHTLCKSPAVRGKNRCRMHGGAKGSGASIGNKNAIKHGFTSKDIIELKKAVKTILKRTQLTLKSV
ncbi:TPA: hypothetical protein JBJ29_14505 [Legionella pneumophila]|nr:hypothetical protein [Legionella pneumophila]HAU1639533.1 hypothetical protein [Legionella pneumophila]